MFIISCNLSEISRRNVFFFGANILIFFQKSEMAFGCKMLISFLQNLTVSLAFLFIRTDTRLYCRVHVTGWN